VNLVVFFIPPAYIFANYFQATSLPNPENAWVAELDAERAFRYSHQATASSEDAACSLAQKAIS
jgi:hypothetical protein